MNYRTSDTTNLHLEKLIESDPEHVPHGKTIEFPVISPGGATCSSSSSIIRPIKILRKRPRTKQSSRQSDRLSARLRKSPELFVDEDSGFEDSAESIPIYTDYEDHQYRHKMRHLVVVLRSDDFAAGPLQLYLQLENDNNGIFAIEFWQEVERFREDYSTMEQSHLLETIDQMTTKFVLTDHGFELIPGMSEFGEYILDIDILECSSFPWSLRIVQRRCMEYLATGWQKYLSRDVKTFKNYIQIASEEKVELLEKRVKSAFHGDIPPLPQTPVRWPGSGKFRRITQSRPSTTMCVPISPRVSEFNTDLLTMGKRSKRSYKLIEQICRLRTKIVQNEEFLSDESDEDGQIQSHQLPKYLREPKLDMKTLAQNSAREYPMCGSVERPKMRVIQSAKKTSTPAYLKSPIRKNGVVYKRPNIRPKVLAECLRDPVHFEFFRRFAKAFNFERAVRFWKAVEEMKRVQDSKLRQTKIRQIVGQFFNKENGVGISGAIMTEILQNAPEKVNGSMLISAQACVLKALEDKWGAQYLATFPGKL